MESSRPGRAVALWRDLDPEGPSVVAWARAPGGSRVAMLMGAFDPVTNAHLAIADAASRTSGLVVALCMTKVLLARPREHMFDVEDRAEILDALTRRIGSPLALANRGTYLDVGRALSASGIEATFIVGSDKLAQLEDPAFYPDGERGVAATFSELRFIVVPREGYAVTRNDVAILEPNDVFADQETATLSATRVRAAFKSGIDVKPLVPPEVVLALGGYTSAR